jgi:hypothetical protein
MHIPKWALFFDFHTMPACPDVGKKFDFDQMTDEIKKCGVDYVVFPARCNLGMAYYDTKIGIRHPHLEYDLLRKLSEACKSKGIALSAYINVGLSHEEGLIHRDWTVVTKEGYAYKPPYLSHWCRNMCYNSPYGDHLVAMLRELTGNYDLAGFFFDCMHVTPCQGVECVREMKEKGIDWQNADATLEFAHYSQLRIQQRLSDTLKAKRDDYLVYFNGPGFEEQKTQGTYLEYECLPTGGWGYDSLPVYARHARTLGKPVLNMTGRFHESWGDFGGLRTEASLEYDCINGLSNAMRTTIGDHFHPRGDINHAMFGLIQGVYGRLRKLEPWLEDAKAETDFAVVVPEKTFIPFSATPECAKSVQGATRLLCELKYQFDVITPRQDFSGYKLLILPDNLVFNDELANRIDSFIQGGGKIVSSGKSGLNETVEYFSLKSWGVKYNGPSQYDPAYFRPIREVAAGMPDMPITLYDLGTDIDAMSGAKVLAEIIAPYFNKKWDGEHAFLYLPPDKATGKPLIVKNGTVVHFSHPVFMSYCSHAQVPLKQLVGNVIDAMLPSPLVKTCNLPSFARVTVTSQASRRMVYVTAYVPEKRGETIQIIEEPINILNIEIALRIDSWKINSVYLAPEKTPLKFSIENGYAKVTVPAISGYAVIVFDDK